MADPLAIFRPDGLDPYDRDAAHRAATDLASAACQLLELAALRRSGTTTTEEAVLRCLFNLDCAFQTASNYAACYRTEPQASVRSCVAAFELAKSVRKACVRAVAEWHADPAAPRDGWASLWEVYIQHFGKSPGPMITDGDFRIEAVDADAEGLEVRGGISIPDDYFNRLWHFRAWPFVCYRLEQIPLRELRGALAAVLKARDGRPVVANSDLPNATLEVLKSDAEERVPRPTRSKRSTVRGEGNEKLIAALTRHHRYANGSCLNDEPIGCNELARQAGVQKGTASNFFKRHFQGWTQYRRTCSDMHRLINSLRLLNAEVSPFHLYGSRPLEDAVEGSGDGDGDEGGT